jgi:hypothetical protein
VRHAKAEANSTTILHDEGMNLRQKVPDYLVNHKMWFEIVGVPQNLIVEAQPQPRLQEL